MKRVLVALAAFSVVGIGSALAAGVLGTSHDFSDDDWNRVGGVRRYELCLPCHTPHDALDLEGAIWNHASADPGSFTTWDGATLGEGSLKCLGCHDGQTALDAFSGQAGDVANVMTGDKVIGADLRDDHPVGVDYPTSGTRFSAVTTVFGGPGVKRTFGTTTVSLPLDGDFAAPTVECTSCHTPHSNDKAPFLRAITSDATYPSMLCVTCHLSQGY
jgi:predicted CXXCH cytochrome family protein